MSRFRFHRTSTALRYAAAILCAFAVSVVFLLALTRFHEDLSHPRVEHLDQAILQGIHTRDTPLLTLVARVLSFIGSPVTLFSVVPVAAGILWFRRLRRDAALLLLGMAGAGSLESIIKLHFRRARPDVPWAFVHERSFSFPSGHSVLALVLYGLLAYLSVRHVQTTLRCVALVAVCLLWIAGIGLSRIYLGAHFPSDVLAGYFVGATWLLFVLAADEMLSGANTKSGVHLGMRGTDTEGERPAKR